MTPLVVAFVLGLAVALPSGALADDRQAGASSGASNSSAAAGQSTAEEGQQAPLPTAVVWYREKAEKGDKEAQYNLGTVYETGFGVVVDYKKAARWFKKAAEQGHVLAQVKLGILYYLGKGVRESSIKGDKWIRSAAKSGNELAVLLQDKVLAPDLAVDLDVKKVVGEVQEALANGDIYAHEKLIQILAKQTQQRKQKPKKPRFAGKVTGSGAKPGTVKTVVPEFLEKEKEHKPKPQNDLASIRRAAKEGDAESQYLLGHMYESGQKVEPDQTEAVKWYRLAALRNQRDAQYRLGLAYLYGHGVEKNSSEAIEWFKKAAKQNVEAARQLISYFRPDENGVINYNISLLVSLYLERALNGDGEAQLALGYMLEHGWGVQANAAEARQWLARARAAGAKGAAVQLRRMKISDSMGTNPVTSEMVASSAPVQSGNNHDGFSPSSEGKFKSLFIPAGLIMIGLVLGMIVFRWLDKGHGHTMHEEKEESIF